MLQSKPYLSAKTYSLDMENIENVSTLSILKVINLLSKFLFILGLVIALWFWLYLLVVSHLLRLLPFDSLVHRYALSLLVSQFFRCLEQFTSVSMVHIFFS